MTFRTLDIGGDKILPYMRHEAEENPALGWRAIRLGLDRPGLMRSQIRALLQAAAGRELKVMFPMVATCAEFDEAKELIERELTALRRRRHKLPDRVEVGAMVEVPSLLFQLDALIAARGFPLGRLQRSGAVPVRRRPRQPARRRTLRSAVGAGAARAAADRRQGARRRQAGGAVRRACLQADRRAGADRLGFRCDVADAVGARRGQGDAARSRRRQGRGAASPAGREPAADGTIRDKLEAFAAAEGLQL